MTGDMVSAITSVVSRNSHIKIARDYIEGMWHMLQQEEAEDFVLATGETHPVREFVEKAFSHVNIKIKYVPSPRFGNYSDVNLDGEAQERRRKD